MKISHVLLKLERGDHQMLTLMEYLDLSESRKRELIHNNHVQFLDTDGRLLSIRKGHSLIQDYLSTKHTELISLQAS